MNNDKQKTDSTINIKAVIKTIIIMLLLVIIPFLLSIYDLWDYIGIIICGFFIICSIMFPIISLAYAVYFSLIEENNEENIDSYNHYWE